MNNCNLTGVVPRTVRQLLSLRHLDLSHNNLSGSLPDTMIFLSQLNYLSVGTNQLTGQFPDWAETMYGLEVLDVASNRLTGIVDENIATLAKLSKVLVRWMVWLRTLCRRWTNDDCCF